MFGFEFLLPGHIFPAFVCVFTRNIHTNMRKIWVLNSVSQNFHKEYFQKKACVYAGKKDMCILMYTGIHVKCLVLNLAGQNSHWAYFRDLED